MGAEADIDPTRRNKRPRPLSLKEKERLDEFIDLINYSARYAYSVPVLLLVVMRGSLHFWQDTVNTYRS